MLYWGKSVIVYMANITLMFDFSGVRGVCCDVGGEMLWRTVEDFSYPGIKEYDWGLQGKLCCRCHGRL